MVKKQTYEELGKKVNELEDKILRRDRLKEELEGIYNFSDDLIGSGNLDGYFTKINSAFERILGYTEKEFLENPFIFFVKKEDVERTKEALTTAASGKGKIFIANRYRCKDGSYKWIEWKVVSIVQENRFYAVGREITQRKRAENKLRESEERFRMIFNHSEDGMIVANPETRKFIYVNTAICKLLGYAEDELTQMGVIDLHPKESLENILSEFEALARGDKSLAKDIPFLKKDGTIIYMDTNASILKIDGKYRIMGVFRDITERKQAEDTLKESEEKYRILFKKANIGIYVVQDGVFKSPNPKALDLFGYSKEEFVSAPFANFIHPEDREMVKDRYERRLRGEEPPTNYPFRLLKKDGNTRWVELNVVSILWEDRPATLCFLTDINAQKQAETALEETKNELERKVQERTMELEEVNTALRVLVKSQNTDVKELENKISFNIDELIFPNLEELKKTKLNTAQRTFLEIIGKNMIKITSDFVADKVNTHLTLTPSEIKITNLIKHGKTNKEIAELHNISVRTVESYRSNIRNKIGIKNKKVNMRSYLISNS